MNFYFRSLLRALSLFLLVCSTIAIQSCASIVDTQNTYDRSATFLSYNNFAWHTANATPDTADNPQNIELDAYLKAAIASELVRKGMRPADEEIPDLIVAYDVSITPPASPIDDAAFAPGFGYGYGYWYGYRYSYGYSAIPDFRRISDYAIGTLTIDLIDPGSNEVVWRGWAEGVLNNPVEVEAGAVSRIVANIMAQYPPPTSAAPGSGR